MSQQNPKCECLFDEKEQCLDLATTMMSIYLRSDDFLQYVLDQIYPWIIISIVILAILVILTIIGAVNQVRTNLGYQSFKHDSCCDCYAEEDLTDVSDIDDSDSEVPSVAAPKKISTTKTVENHSSTVAAPTAQLKTLASNSLSVLDVLPANANKAKSSEDEISTVAIVHNAK